MDRKLSFLSHRLPWYVAGFLIASALIWIGMTVVFPHQLLTLDSGDIKADALVVLGGGSEERPARAAQLFKAGAAPVILVSGFGDGDRNAQVLKKDGVPDAAILREPRSLSTLENAKFSLLLLRQKGVHRVIIVTSWYHSRRALACFRQMAPDLQFYSRPAYQSYPRAEWNRENTNHYIRIEYIKLLGYWTCYGVSPF